MDDATDRIKRLITDLVRVHSLTDEAQTRLQAAIETDDAGLPRLRKEATAAAELVFALQDRLLKCLEDEAARQTHRPRV